MRVKAFRALRPVPEKAEDVASVAYDTLDSREARELAAGNPLSFLHVVRPEIDLPEGTDIYADEVYAKARENLDGLEASGAMVRDDGEYFYIYRQRMGDHVQTGVVGCCHAGDYEQGLIVKHEKTRAVKEDDRARHVLTLNANTGPVFLMHRPAPEVSALVAEATTGTPLYDLTAADGVQHTVWRVSANDTLAEAFADVPLLYVADGHHRAAAAARAARARAEQNPEHTGQEEYNWLLAVMFPAEQLQILPVNRCVADLNGHSPEAFMAAITKVCSVEPATEPTPPVPGEAGMYLGGKWYRLRWEIPADADPVDRLDVSFLQSRVLDPLLGIDDPRTNKRVSFIGGIRGIPELEKRVDSGRDAVAFLMYPVTVDQVMDIGDADRVMPPKSTWFEPKLRSGLFVHFLD